MGFRSTVILLLCLVGLNAAFGASGDLLLCIHHDESDHLVQSQAEDCCHEHPYAGGEAPYADACDHCTDLTLAPADLTSIRVDDSLSIAPLLVVALADALWQFHWSNITTGHVRGLYGDPPAYVTDAARGIRSVILRL